jgi:hypothetical protein
MSGNALMRAAEFYVFHLWFVAPNGQKHISRIIKQMSRVQSVHTKHNASHVIQLVIIKTTVTLFH